MISLNNKNGRVAADESYIMLAEVGLFKELKSMNGMYGEPAGEKVLSMESEQTNRYDAGVA